MFEHGASQTHSSTSTTTSAPTAPHARRGAFVASVVIFGIALTLWSAGCSSRPDPAGDGTLLGGAPGSSCGTPNEDCPCDQPGAVVECGSVEQRSGDYVTCAMGHRSCDGTRWGACQGSVLTTKSLSPGLHMLGLAATPGACAGPCDPYCEQFADVAEAGVFADSGLSFGDGGLTINPGDGGASVVSSGFTSTAAGVTDCSPNNNIVGTGAARSCVPGAGSLSTCQQDFHCDAITSTCLWNGGPGYVDSTCSGVDLTVGAPCGTSGSAPPTVPLCNRGTGTLASGATITLTQTNGQPDPCTNLGPPTCTYTLPVALVAGACVALTYCQNSPGNKFIAVNAGVPGQPVASGGPAVVECSNTPAGQRCQNNAAYMKTDGSSCGLCATCNTTLSGKVYDPSGASTQPLVERPVSGANDVFLPGIQVFQPSAALTPLVDGVACDTCASLSTPLQSGAVTDATGSFTLNQVSPGASGTVPIVVQSGRWRRKINITTADLVNGTNGIIACVDNPVKAGKLRMPRSKVVANDNPANAQAGVVSDVPKIALVMGNREALECGILRYGIHPSEFAKRSGPADTNRIQLYSNVAPQGMTTATGLPPAGSTIWGAGGDINEYSAMILPCSYEQKEVGGAYAAAADKSRVIAWTAAGGRVFMDHWAGEAFIHNAGAPFATTATWGNPLPANALGTARGKILATTAPQTQLRDWMLNVGGSADWGVGWMRSDQPWHHALDPNAAVSTQWLRGLSTYAAPAGNQWTGTPNGDYSLSYSFEVGKNAASAPVVGIDSAAVSCGVAGGTGRVIYNGMHVSQARVPGGGIPDLTMTFPLSCVANLPLSSEERALEYQFFQLTACAIGGAPPPPPPPPPVVFASTVVSRDYVATCHTGFKPVWQFFYWQSKNPTAVTQVQFRAATASIGAATTTIPAGPLPAPQWGSDALTVDQELVAQAAKTSSAYLRVFMTFVPDNTVSPSQSPSLTAWNQTYDCVPNE
jgi:hypothetical protein